MAGIYVHIPFCKQACHYCNFHFSTSLGLMDELVASLVNEISLQKDYLNNAKIKTIYFGGGTPSILAARHINKLLETIYKHHTIAESVELTLEANPDDLSKEKLTALSQIGVNRLSIGIQSFFDKDLEWMNRSHNAGEAKSCIQFAQEVGITDLSIDLIFGSETTTMEMWKENLEQTIQLDIPHVSCYGLTVEKGTALAHFIQSGKMKNLDNNLGAEQFEFTTQFLTGQAYEHYEISNYAKDQRYSKHNTNYWRQIPYLGIGPAAHSYNGNSRQWNVNNNKKYITALNDNQLPSNMEVLSSTDKFNEYIMTGLRTMWGCDVKQLDALVPDWRAILDEELSQNIETGNLHIDNKKVYLSNAGKLIADKVMGQLFITTEN